MLIACGECRRQYDVGDLTVGTKVHCHCGAAVEVPKVQARDATLLHCSGCGGHLERGADRCDYCGATVSRDEHNFGPACPECFARMIDSASYCSSCGVKISAERVDVEPFDGDCPRCEQSTLQRRSVSTGSFCECTSCGGIWLVEQTFEELVTQRDEGAVGAFLKISTEVARKKSEIDEAINEVKYLRCPDCNDLMHRRNFGRSSGVIIDTCKGHGAWFDIHELEAVLQFVQKGGLDRARQAELRDHERKVDLARQRTIEARSADSRYHGGTGASAWSEGFDLFEFIYELGRNLFRR